MKILMATPFYYPIIGGTESFIENLSVSLNEMGTHTDILTFNIDQTWKPWSINQIRKREIVKINGLKVIRIPALTLLPTRFIFRINFIPGRVIDIFDNYDIIHFHNDIDLSFPLFSYMVDKPKILHCHLLNITYNYYKKNPIQKYIFKKVVDFYIVPSVYMLKILVDIGIPATKIKVIHNGINVKKFHPSGETRIDNLILFVGRFHPIKGLDILLKALKYLETGVRLVIIGPPSSHSGYFKKILKSIRSINEKTPKRVIYLGAQKKEALIKWYQKATIFVCPSLSEPFGIVNIEAMSCATPVVATCVGGIPEIVNNYKNGILVPPNNAVKLAEAIQYLLDNEEIRKKFGEEGRKWVVKNFSSEAVANRLCNIYEEMMCARA